MRNWTQEQLDVIESRNKNILVSAGAGSGKTSVMVERIKNMVINDGVSVDSILVMTFTNAAAQKMKTEISKAISEAMDDENADIELLSKQLSLLDDANISTFHSFQIKIIKEYFSLIDASPMVSIGDEKDMALLLKETVDEVFEDLFNEENQDFLSFLDVYTGVKSDDNLKENIISFYYSLRAIPFYMEKLNLSIDDYTNFENSKAFKYIISDCKNRIDKLKDIVFDAIKLLDTTDLDKIKEGFYELKSTLDLIYSYASEDKFDLIYGVIDGIKVPRLTLPKGEEHLRDELKQFKTEIDNERDDMKKKYFYQDFSSHIEELKILSNYSKTLSMIIQELDIRYMEKKTERNSIDFSDIEHMSLKILENDFVCKEYRDRFKYIFLDEYQDSSFMQEAFIDRIKGEDNLFMVGDVKQSIYGFRNAEPQLFLNKRVKYSDSDNSEVLYLKTNFRSRDRILKDINYVFNRGILDSFTDDDNLISGAKYEGNDFGIELDLITCYKDLDDDSDAKILELEAMNTALRIKSLLNENIYKSENDRLVEKPIEYGDITILLRKNNDIKLYREVLKKMGIPTNIKEDGGYFKSFEIQLLLDILKVTDNKKRDIPLISVLHSIIFDFSFEDLAKISIGRKNLSVWNRLIEYSKDGKEKDLLDKVNLAIDTISLWQRIVNSFSVDEYIEYILKTTDIYLYFGSFEHGEKRQNNLKMLVGKAKDFSNRSSQGIYSFLKYIEKVIDKDIDFAQSQEASIDENSVSIMTIHHSKGLDFPVVIIPNLSSDIISRRSTSDSSTFSLKKDFGLGMKYIREAESKLDKNIILNAIHSLKLEEEYQEGIRLFYVALTRVEQRLILSSSFKDDVKFNKFNRNTFFDLVGDIYESFNTQVYDSNYVYGEYNRLLKDVEIDYEVSTEDFGDFFDERLNYTLPLGSDVRLKYSVTEYTSDQKMELDDTSINYGSSISTRDGIINHMVLEKIDFSKLRELDESGMKKYLLDVVDNLYEISLITENEKGKILVPNILNFLLSDIGKALIKSDEVYKEQPFILRKYDDGTPFMIQGVIDCFFKGYSGEYVLLDYKLSNIKSDEDLMKIYKKQLDIYEEAIVEAKGVKVSSKNLYILNQNKLLKY